VLLIPVQKVKKVAINNDRNLLEQQILSNSGLKGKELENLRARLATLSEQQLQAELSKSLSGGDKGEWYTGIALEHNESVVMRNNHDQTTYTDDNGNEISELKDGDEVLERTIKSTDDKGNVFETTVTFSGGRPLTQTKSKNGNTTETTTYKYNDDAEVPFVTVQTKKADQSKVMTNVLEVDENGNFNNEDFIDRQTTSMDGTTTHIFTENNCVIEQQVKPNGKKVDTIYKGDSIEDYDNKKLNRIYQRTELKGEVHEVAYDGNGNTRTVVQNGESPSTIARKFGVKESSLRKLNPARGKNAITQVGADIVVPGEYDADSRTMRTRKTKQGALNDYANDEVGRVAERLYSSSMQEVTLDRDYKDAYGYARALLAADGVKNPSNEQINNKANEILVANGNIKFKKGTKVQIASKTADSKFVAELSNNGFKPTRENAIFYNRFNALNPTQQQNVLSVIKYCKSQNITDPNKIKARILETFPEINLFDSGKTVSQSDFTTPAYQRKNPVALETFLTETLKLDLKSDVGQRVYNELAQKSQAELNLINAQNFGDLSKANFNEIADKFESSGVNIRTQLENQIEQANRAHREERLGIPQQKFTSEMLANIYDRAADMMEEYYHNHGVLDAGTYLEGMKNLMDWITPDNLFGIDMRSTLHVASDCRKAAQRFRQMHTDNPETFKREYEQLKKDGLVTADYNKQNVQEFMNLIQSGEVDINSDKFKNACQKAFGFKGVENTEKYIQTGQMAGNIGDIAVMLYTLGAASELKMMGKATQGVYGALEKGAGRIMSKTAAQKTAKIGTSMAMGGTTLGGFTLGKETLNNLSNSMRDATSWETWKETGIASAESFGFGAFGGLLNETVVAPIVKAIEKPVTKATQAVSKALTEQGELTGKQIMQTVSDSGSLKLDGLFKMDAQEWANFARTATAKGVGFGVEVGGFTAYEVALDVVKDIIDYKTGRLPESMTIDSLTEYLSKNMTAERLGEKFSEQLSNLGTIKGISQLLMMSKGGKVAQKAMMNEFLSKSDALKDIKFKKAEINGHEVYEVTYPNGNRAVVSSPEQAIATCQMAMQMEFLVKSFEDVETPKGKLNDVREASATNPAEIAEQKILSEVARTEFRDEGMRLNTPESLDTELAEAELNPNAPVDNLETLSLVINGKLGETLKSQYEKAGKVFEEVITKNATKIGELEQKYKDNKAQLANEFTQLLAEQIGVKGIEPEIEFVDPKDAGAAGYFNWTTGKLLINKELKNPKDIETIIAHEFVHVMQFKDIVAARGEDAIRDIYTKNNDGKYLESKTREWLKEEYELDYDKEAPEDQELYRNAVLDALVKSTVEANDGLIKFAQEHPLEKGSLNEYLSRIYQAENENMAVFDTPEYYSQVIENEAYFLGNGKLGDKVKINPSDIRLNQSTDEVRTMVSNYITRLRQTSNGEDVTLKINGEEQIFQAYKGNAANNGGGYAVTDGENVYILSPKMSKELCYEELLADELYNQIIGCLPKEKVVVETDNGYAVMTKSVFNKGGFNKNVKDAIVQTYAMDALLGNVDNIALVSKGKNPVLISNNSSINLRRSRNGFIDDRNSTAVYQLASMFEVAHGLSPGSKNATEMRKASKEELISSLQKVADISDEQLLEIVNRSEVEHKEQLGKILVGRKHFIARFLENLKATEQEGLPIEDFVSNVYRKTYAENTYENLKGNTNTEFTDYISEKFNFTELELLDYQKILQHPEFASHLKEKIEDGTVSKEDLIEFNSSKIFSDLSFIRENPNNKGIIFDTILDLKKNNGMAMDNAYLLIRRFAEGKDGEVISQRILTNIKEINQELGGNTNSVLFQKLFKDIQTCEIDRTKLDIVKDLKNRGIDDKYLVLLLDNISNPDGTINVEKQNALNGLFEHNTPIEDIPMYFSAVNTPYGFDANMILLVDKYKELGLDNDLITNMVLSSRVTVEGGKRQQRTHALEIPLMFPDELSNRRLLNEAIGELKLWTPNVENDIKKAIEKNPNMKLADLIPMLRSFHKDRIFDQQGYSTAFRLLEDGVSPTGMGSFIAATKITPRPVNGLTPEEAATQTTKLRDVGEYLLDSGYTTEQVYKLIEVSKTNGKIDDFVLDLIQNNSHKYNANDLLCLINYSKVIPGKDVPVESVNPQRQQIFDTMTDLMQNKGYSAIDAGKSIVQALSVQRFMTSSQVTGLNTNTLDFCKKCNEHNLSVDEVQLLAYNSRILDNVSGFTPEEINAKQKTMLDWADKLLFEDKLPPKTVATFMEIAAFTNNSKVVVNPLKRQKRPTFNFDENVINVINRMIKEKAITPESDANISQVILGFKLLDYDENAINTTMKLLKNPITLENGKQYDLDANFLGNIIAGSRDPKTNKFDIDKFNKNVQLYILKADHGFSLNEMVTLAKLYKGDITIDKLSTGQKVNLLNKISYASKDAIKLIQDKVIDTKDANGNTVSGDVELLTQKLLTDINLASKNIRTNQAQRQEFLQNFISNKGRNTETGLNDIETKISQFDFTQYGKDGLPLKYSRNEFTANIREILSDLSPEEQASVLRFHNIDLGENGFNSNPRIKRINQPVEQLTNEGYKNVITELSTLLKGINEDNLQLYKENNIDNIIKKCIQLAQLSESQIAELVRDYPELNVEDIKTLQTHAREFAELVENNDVGNLPTPLAVKTANEEIEGFNQFSDKMKAASAKIEQEYNKFIYENEFKTGDAELDNILNGIMRGLPDVMLTVGKQQHKTHAYSVDVHTMEVLKKAMNDPEYKTLSDKDRTILKFSILLHDFGKKFINPETPDTGHEIDSAEIASGIMAQFKLPATVKERILNIIKNHDWFARYNKSDWNANKVAALFRSPDDYKIAKIMSKADLFSINPDFQYDPKVLNIKEDRTIEHASRVFDEKLKNLDAAYQKMYAKTNIVMNSKILNPNKIPMDEQYGVRVLNLTDESIPSDMDLGQYGMNGTTKDNLRLTVHMVAEDNLLGNLESAKLGMESTTNDNNTWSISLIKMNKKDTYYGREYGFLTDTPVSSLALASPGNAGTGYEKTQDRFVELLFSDTPNRNYLKQKFMISTQNQGHRITETDYQELSRMIYNKSFISQLETKSEIEVNGNVYPTSVIVKAIQESTDALFANIGHNELVAVNPKIQGLVVRKSSMDEVAPDFIAFAKKYNLPILLVGNR